MCSDSETFRLVLAVERGEREGCEEEEEEERGDERDGEVARHF